MKILIGCPTSDRYKYCIELWLNAVNEIKKFSKNEIDYLLVDNSYGSEFYNTLKRNKVNVIKGPYTENAKERIVNSRNLLRKKVLEGGYDYFLSLEQDVIPEKDVLDKLLAHKKDIVSAYYGKPASFTVLDKETNEAKNVTVELSMIFLQHGENAKRVSPTEMMNKGLIKPAWFGVGCLLISKRVLEKIEFRFESEREAYDDFYFCNDAKKAGFELFADTDIQVAHLHKNWF